MTLNNWDIETDLCTSRALNIGARAYYGTSMYFRRRRQNRLRLQPQATTQNGENSLNGVGAMTEAILVIHL
jgi:hypothetical protein